MSFKVLDGSFGKGAGSFNGKTFILPKRGSWGFEYVAIGKLASVEVANEANVKKLAGTVGWGAVGALALGPVGMLAGLLAGGRKTEVTFICEFVDGGSFIATGDHTAWVRIKASSLEPIAKNARLAAEANTPKKPIVKGPAKGLTGLQKIRWALEKGGWDYSEEPITGLQQVIIIEATRKTRKAMIIHQPALLTRQSVDQIAAELTRRPVGGNPEKIIFCPPSDEGSVRYAAQLGLVVGGYSDLETALVRGG